MDGTLKAMQERYRRGVRKLHLLPGRQMVGFFTPQLQRGRAQTKRYAGGEGKGGGRGRAGIQLFPVHDPRHQAPEGRIDAGKAQEVGQEGRERRRRYPEPQPPQKNVAGRRVEAAPHAFAGHDCKRAAFFLLKNRVFFHLRISPDPDLNESIMVG